MNKLSASILNIEQLLTRANPVAEALPSFPLCGEVKPSLSRYLCSLFTSDSDLGVLSLR